MSVAGYLVIIIAIGLVAGYVIRKKQEITILSKLRAEEAKVFYEKIAKRPARIGLVSLIFGLFLFLGALALAFMPLASVSSSQFQQETEPTNTILLEQEATEASSTSLSTQPVE